MRKIKLLVMLFFLVSINLIFGGIIPCDNSFYFIGNEGNNTQLNSITFDTNGNPSFKLKKTFANLSLRALAYYNGYLYAMKNESNTMCKIGDDFEIIDSMSIVGLKLSNDKQWTSGAISREGIYYFLNGYNNPIELSSIQLKNNSNTFLNTIATKLPGNSGDIVVDLSGQIIAACTSKGLYVVNETNGDTTRYSTNTSQFNMGSMFIDDRNQIYSFGSQTSEPQNQLFKLNNKSKQFESLTKVENFYATDGCSCPWRLVLNRGSDSDTNIVGKNYEYAYNFRNSTGTILTDIVVKDTLDPRFSFTFSVSKLQNSIKQKFGLNATVTLSNTGNGAINNIVSIKGLSIPLDSSTFRLQYIPRKDKKFIHNEVITEQAYISSLLTLYDQNDVSDYEKTTINRDPTPIVMCVPVQVFVSENANKLTDSIFYSYNKKKYKVNLGSFYKAAQDSVLCLFFHQGILVQSSSSTVFDIDSFDDLDTGRYYAQIIIINNKGDLKKRFTNNFYLRPKKCPNVTNIEYKQDKECDITSLQFLSIEGQSNYPIVEIILSERINGKKYRFDLQAANKIPNGTYHLSMVDTNRCESLKLNFITVDHLIDCELFFSPNGDGYSDDFFIQGNGLSLVRNKLGVIVKELKLPTYWDGTNSQGFPLEIGLYIIDYQNGKKAKVSLLR